MRYAIVGYGNLGKALERAVSAAGEQTAAVYSRRKITHPLYRPMKELGQRADFDVALVALGSYADVEQYAPALAPLNTVDSFDTHTHIAEYKQRLRELKRDSLAIISAGWDPGLLSLARAVWGIGAHTTATLWGEGVSQGHSNAVRAIPGVIDAVQFTLPKPNALQLVAEGVTDARLLHDRVCYVACVQTDRAEIEAQIKAMPNYFDGYNTVVHFASPREVAQQKERTHHRGQVVSLGHGFEASSTVQMDSNADYTAAIMLAYAHALPRLKQDGFVGALDVLDIPLRYLAQPNVL